MEEVPVWPYASILLSGGFLKAMHHHRWSFMNRLVLLEQADSSWREKESVQVWKSISVFGLLVRKAWLAPGNRVLLDMLYSLFG